MCFRRDITIPLKANITKTGNIVQLLKELVFVACQKEESAIKSKKGLSSSG